MNGFQVLKILEEVCFGFWSIERPGTKASNSEIRRWFINKAVIINGKPVNWDDLILEVNSVVLFPNGRRKTTLW